MADAPETTPQTSQPDQRFINSMTDPPARDTGPINMDREVTYGGRSYKISELLETVREKERLEEKVKEADSFRENTRKLLTSDDLGEVGQVARQVYTDIGADPQTIEREVQALQSSGNGQGDQPQAQNGQAQGQGQAQQAQSQTQGQGQAQGAQEGQGVNGQNSDRLQKTIRQQLTMQTRSRIREALEGSDKVQRVAKWMKEQGGEGGEERAKKLMERLENDAYQKTVARFNQESARTGEPDLEALEKIAQESSDSAQEDLDMFYGDTATLGRSAEDIQAEAARKEFLEKEPVKLDVNEAVSPEAAEQQVSQFFEDSIKRDVAEIESEDSGSAV